MKFIIKKYKRWLTDKEKNDKDSIYLITDNWNDFGYYTLFQAYYLGENIGYIKIAYNNMPKDQRPSDTLPLDFEQLAEPYYSLWQSENAYIKVREIGEKRNENLFEALNDIAFNLDALNLHLEEEVLRVSLFREISEIQCRNQLHRIATGGVILTKYSFRYTLKDKNNSLDFFVFPNSYPMTNIHTLIGRNGIGKTNLIKDMIKTICGEKTKWKLDYLEEESLGTFANVLCVAFSPFDDFSEIVELSKQTGEKQIKCSYIGLDKENPKLLKNIEDNFVSNLRECHTNRGKIERWKKAIEIICNDPAFCETEVQELAHKEFIKEDGTIYTNVIERAGDVFKKLSSGHKCVLSTITCCVNQLEEKSIVFIDEPENHLHPPLLSSLIQALSYLLIDRNGVAIVSTHSPVVLQEVPKSCVWVLNRFGDDWECHRPKFETFGADLGSLTREIFGLEVMKSGYHQAVQNAVNESNSLSEVIDTFSKNLGNEALGLAYVLWDIKESEGANNE